VFEKQIRATLAFFAPTVQINFALLLKEYNKNNRFNNHTIETIE